MILQDEMFNKFPQFAHVDFIDIIEKVITHLDHEKAIEICNK